MSLWTLTELGTADDEPALTEQYDGEDSSGSNRA